MPQVAQQDYIRIAPKAGRVLIQDAAALGQIKAAISKDTLWDCICANIQTDDNSFGKILGVLKPSSVDVWDAANGEAFTLDVEFTVEQYEGLSAVQLAEDERSGVAVLTLPTITYDENYFLMDDEQGVLICIDDYKLIVTDNEGKIGALSMSDQKPGPDVAFVNITWEDAQKLIGLSIA